MKFGEFVRVITRDSKKASIACIQVLRASCLCCTIEKEKDGVKSLTTIPHAPLLPQKKKKKSQKKKKQRKLYYKIQLLPGEHVFEALKTDIQPR